MTVPYVELHAHSAFSFLDGASAPEEMAEPGGRAGPRGARAHRSRRALRVAGVRPRRAGGRGAADHGGRAHAGGRRPPDAAGRDAPRATPTSAGSSRSPTPTPARRPTGARCRRRSTAPRLAAHAEGLVCLTGCARHGLVPRLVARRAAARGRGGACAAWCATFGPGNVYVEIQLARDARATGALARDLARLAEAVGVPCVATGDPHAHHPRRALLQDAFVAIAAPPHPRRLGGRAARQPPGGAAPARGDRGPASPTTRRRWPRRLRAGRAARLRPHPRPRLPLPRLRRVPPRRDRPGRALAARLRATSSARATPTPASGPRRACGWTRSSRSSPTTTWPASSCCTATSWSWRARWRCSVRPPGSARRWLPPGRGRGSSVGSIVCYLTGLSHIDPVENRLFLGPLPQPRHGVGAGHRPRLPARRPRGG